MTSLLAFAWRKANTSNHALMSSKHHEQDISPGVSASSSGETTLSKQTSEDSLFENVPPPQTPEALRRRNTTDEIRQELGISKRLNWEREPRASCLAPGACSMLPPMMMSCGSPMKETSSFYSRNSSRSTYVAESPNLKVGQAKTAVGSLLAMAEDNDNAHVSFHESTKDPIRLHQESSILPPRAWLEDHRTIEEANDFSIELPYEALNDSKNHLSPMKNQQGFQRPESPSSDDESSIHASPSSNHWRNSRAAPHQHPETSFTRGFLNAEQNVSRDHYDFHPIVGDKDLFANERLNMSGISQSTKDLESLHSLMDEDEDDAEEESEYYQMMQTDEQEFSNTERRLKEELLLSTLERLQDGPDLVLEVMTALRESIGQQGVSVRPGEDNLFTGFCADKREALARNIDTILKELQVTPQEECFVTPQEPEYAETYEDLKQALLFCRSLVRIAIPSTEKPSMLEFSCTGFPQQGHRWKCVPGFRSALGFHETPKSPETVRGGDTSLFSLPSGSANEATPHTSNVSMTSTITSAFSLDRNSRQLSHPLKRENLRRGLEAVATLFDRLSAACVKLLDAIAAKQDTSIKAAEEVKQIYLQLLTISNDDLKALIDSFELDFLPLNIKRLVSEDNGETDHAMNTAATHHLSQPHPLVRSTVSVGAGQQLVMQTMGIPLESLKVNVVEDDEEEDYNLFSPNTEDMNSIEENTDTYDDLRRIVGSFEENEEEEREAPPPPVVPQQVEKKNKKRGLWRRRQPPRQLAAE